MRALLLLPLGAALLLTGCDAAGDNASVAPIQSIMVTDIPVPSDEDGSAPDIFFEVQDLSGRSVYRSAVQTDADVSDGASFSVTEAVAVPTSTMPLRISVYDFDGSLNTSTLMAKSETFTASQIAASEETTLNTATPSATRFTVARSAQ